MEEETEREESTKIVNSLNKSSVSEAVFEKEERLISPYFPRTPGTEEGALQLFQVRRALQQVEGGESQEVGCDIEEAKSLWAK
jgi:hypothetical protein